MMRKAIVLLTALMLTSASAWALELGGVEIPDTAAISDTNLVLNGVGLRKKFGMKIYAVGLYLKAKSTDGQAIIDADEPMRLEMHWRMSSPSQKIDETYYESFAGSVGAPKASSYGPQTDFGPMSKDIVTFMSWLNQRATTKQDVWTYDYIPGKGTEVYINDGTKKELKGVVPGLDFKKALFKIWLAEDPPVGKGLREDLLGM
ncbi:chalcone isomerase family protein [Desulfatiferula olefinivorans]